MIDERLKLEKTNILRLSNEEANKLARESIQNALVRLLAEEDIESISISRIVRKAGVSRTAFYNNYTSKEDVLRSVSASMLKKISRLVHETIVEEHREKAYEKVFRSVKNDPCQFRMLLESGIREREYLDYNAYVTERYPNLDVNIRLLLFALAGMITSVVLDWFDRGMREEVRDMAMLCTQLTDDIMRRISVIDPGFTENAKKAGRKPF